MTKENIIKNPWFFIPTLYFAQGIPFILVNQLSAAMFKSLDASNTFIGLTSFLYIPWSIKFLWGPLVDGKSTKRTWLLSTQIILGLLFALNAIAIQMPYFILLTLALFTLIAFISATHDIAIDGYYLYSLDEKNQAFFVGIRSAFYRLAMIFAGGLLVSLAGIFGTYSGSLKIGWSLAFGISAFIFVILFFYHKFVLPYPADDAAIMGSKSSIPFKAAFKGYFSQKNIGIILAFILLYRFGEGLLLKMTQPFLLDSGNVGGMEISLTEIGIIYGTFGVLALVFGGIFGGWLIKKFGLRKLIWPLAISIHLPNILYVYLAASRPDITWHLNLSFLSSGTWILAFHPIVQLCIIVEQFGYGLGFSSFMVYLLYISKGRYKTSHYAISTGLMAIGMMVPGFLSGWLQQQVGYLWLFIICCIATLPGMLTIFFLPFNRER